jgi:hypothetical protein
LPISIFNSKILSIIKENMTASETKPVSQEGKAQKHII